MRQATLAAAGFERYSKLTRRASFLAEMDRVVPWRELSTLFEPMYPKPGKGRSPIGLERMLRIYFLQPWFNLAAPGAEEALHDSLTMRRFAGIDLGREPVPDETTLCKFRHLLERHELGSALFQQVHEHLEQHGLRCPGARSSMPPSSMRQAQRRMRRRHASRRCTRPRRATNGISG